MAETGVGAERGLLRSVALPTEHGGWSLTLEPVILGLIVAPSGSGFALGLAALVAFVARTPLKTILIDRWRGRWMARSSLALRVVTIEMALIAVLLGVAIVSARASFWWPIAVAAPLIAVELWYDMRSRSRRLVPELAGTAGIAAVAAVIGLAGGAESEVAAGLWLVMSARGVAAIPFVRIQLLRAKGRAHTMWHSDLAQVLAALLATIGWIVGLIPPAAVFAVALQVGFELIAVRRPPQKAAVIGAQQVVVGLTVVLIAALGFRAP